MIDADAGREGGAVSVAEPPEKSLTASASRRWLSVREMMVATAAIAFLLAAYRIEVRGARGLGLVPACALLIAATWYRESLAARVAAGRPVDLDARVALAGGSLLAGLAIVFAADLAFILVAAITELRFRAREFKAALSQWPPTGGANLVINLVLAAGYSAAAALAVSIRLRKALRRPWSAAERARRTPEAHSRIWVFMVEVATVGFVLSMSFDMMEALVGVALLATAAVVMIAERWYVDARRRAEREGGPDDPPAVAPTASDAVCVGTAMVGAPGLAFVALYMLLGDPTIGGPLHSPLGLGENLISVSIALFGGALPVALGLRRLFWPVGRDTQPSQT